MTNLINIDSACFATTPVMLNALSTTPEFIDGSLAAIFNATNEEYTEILLSRTNTAATRKRLRNVLSRRTPEVTKVFNELSKVAYISVITSNSWPEIEILHDTSSIYSIVAISSTTFDKPLVVIDNSAICSNKDAVIIECFKVAINRIKATTADKVDTTTYTPEWVQEFKVKTTDLGCKLISDENLKSYYFGDADVEANKVQGAAALCNIPFNVTEASTRLIESGVFYKGELENKEVIVMGRAAGKNINTDCDVNIAFLVDKVNGTIVITINSNIFDLPVETFTAKVRALHDILSGEITTEHLVSY